MSDYYKAPHFSARFQAEQDDFDRVQSVPREALDNQYNRVLRGADAGPLSQGSRRAQAQERESMWGMRDEANRMGAKANAFKRHLSDRDLQWQNMQQDRSFRQQMMEREMTQREGETKYQRERDAKADERADRNMRINAAIAKMNSGDEEMRVIGEQEYNALIGSGSSAPSAPAARPVAPAQGQPVAADGYYENAGGAAAAPTDMYQQRLADIRERKKKAEARLDEDRAFKREQDAYAFANDKFSDSEARHEKQRGEKFKVFQAMLDRTKNPSGVTDIMNKMAGESASLAPMVNQPKGMMGIGDAVGGALKSAYGEADKAGQFMARHTFSTDPLEQAQYEANLKRDTGRINQGAAFEDVADAQKVLASDPQVSNAVDALKRELATIGSNASKSQALNSIASILTLGIAGGGPNVGKDAASIFAKKISDIAESTASRYGVKPETLRQVILTQLSSTLQAPSFDSDTRQKFSDTLMSPFAKP